MENRYGLYSKGSSGWTSMRNEDLQEEDVWGVPLKERTDSDSKFITTTSFKEPSLLPRRIPTATRMIPKPESKSKSNQPIIQQHSAPVNIPDWSKIYGNHSSTNNSSWLDPHTDDNRIVRSSFESDEEEDDDNEADLIPPHEWIARRQKRNQISSFSVCEGVGRTLKGRDLSRVRNAVLTRTGFLES